VQRAKGKTHFPIPTSAFRLPNSDFPWLSAFRFPLSSGSVLTTLHSRPSSDFRIPPSDFKVADALFARLDDADARIGNASDEDESEDRRTDESEEGLDLWSVLYGLD
jgi:hypothetical protein